MAEFLIKKIIAVSYKLRIGTDAITTMIENTRKSMVVDSRMTFASKPPDDVVIDWHLATLDPDKDGNVKAANKHSIGTGAYLVKLYSKSTSIHRCDFKNQKKGEKIVKKEYDLKSFGYKRKLNK